MSTRVAGYRDRMKKRGYKEVRYWVPDVHSPAFATRIETEAAALNAADRDGGIEELLIQAQSETLAQQ